MKKTVPIIALFALILTLFASVPTVFADPSSSPVKVACVGDSITQGLGNTPYPSRLQDLLGDGYEVKNFGLYATTACNNTARPYTTCDDSPYKDSLEYKPDVVIIMLGTNDGNESGIQNAREHYKEDMTALINSYLSLESRPTVWIATSPYAYLSSNAPVNTEIAPMQRELAKELSLPLIDLHALTADMPQNFQDGLHPTEAGYFYLALSIYEQVFGGAVADVTVKTTPKAGIMLGAYSVKADENGEALLRVPVGKQLICVTSRDYEPIYSEISVPGDCIVECRLSQSINIALAGSPLTNGTADGSALALDGDLSTGWQSESKNAGLYYGVDLQKNRTFSRVTVCFETATRAQPTAEGYTVEYSADGSSWVAVSDPVYSFGDGDYNTVMDSVMFSEVAARYVRIVMNNFTSEKYAPKIYEFSVYAASPDSSEISVTAIDRPISSDTGSEPDESVRSGGLKKTLIYAAAAAVAVVTAVCAAAVAFRMKKKNHR